MKKRKSRIAALIAAALLVLLLAGCATVGRDFPVDPVGQIKIGTTTKTDIKKMFGNPWRTGIEDGQTTWTYGYYKYRMIGESTTRDLVVRYDAGGQVTSYSFNTSEIEE